MSIGQRTVEYHRLAGRTSFFSRSELAASSSQSPGLWVDTGKYFDGITFEIKVSDSETVVERRAVGLEEKTETKTDWTSMQRFGGFKFDNHSGDGRPNSEAANILPRTFRRALTGGFRWVGCKTLVDIPISANGPIASSVLVMVGVRRSSVSQPTEILPWSQTR